MPRKKVLETMNIGIAVSFDGSLKRDWKIVTVLTTGSTATVTTWGSSTRDGTTYIPSHVLKQMFANSGQRVIEATQENGNEI